MDLRAGPVQHHISNNGDTRATAVKGTADYLVHLDKTLEDQSAHK
jgi:hypothetical protein